MATRQAVTMSRSAPDFEDVAAGAGLQGFEEELVVVVHGQDQHRQVRAAA